MCLFFFVLWQGNLKTNGLYYLETELCIGVSIETGVLYLIWGKKRKKNKCLWIITMFFIGMNCVFFVVRKVNNKNDHTLNLMALQLHSHNHRNLHALNATKQRTILWYHHSIYVNQAVHQPLPSVDVKAKQKCRHWKKKQIHQQSPNVIYVK